MGTPIELDHRRIRGNQDLTEQLNTQQWLDTLNLCLVNIASGGIRRARASAKVQFEDSRW
jgi:hypothetical protein